MSRLDELHQLELDNVETIGLTAAASTPEAFVEDAVDALKAMGFTDVETLETAKEEISFPMPVENQRAPTSC